MKFTRFDVYLCLAALISSVVIGVAYLDSGQREILKQIQELRARGGVAPQNAVQPAKPAPPPTMPAEIGIAGSPSRGNAAAKVVMVEFSDIECPYCGRYTRETLPSIEKDYIATGKVHYVWRNFPLPPGTHPHAQKAAEAADCARQQDKFWPMHDFLYAHQDQLDVEQLPVDAKTVGLDMPAFNACFSSGKGAERVAFDHDAGAAVGINGTPYFLFGVPEAGGKIRVLDYIYQGAVPLQNFKAILDKLLAGAK